MIALLLIVSALTSQLVTSVHGLGATHTATIHEAGYSPDDYYEVCCDSGKTFISWNNFDK